MVDFIFVHGCPGAGKSSVCSLIQQKNSWPMIDFGCLRQFHLNNEWSNTSTQEEQMSFENLMFILKNYFHYGYKNILINDLTDAKVEQLSNYLSHEEFTYLIITLTVSDDELLKARVLEPSRDSGFRHFGRAIEYNRNLKSRKLFTNEFRLDNTKITADRVLQIVNQFIEERYK